MGLIQHIASKQDIKAPNTRVCICPVKQGCRDLQIQSLIRHLHRFMVDSITGLIAALEGTSNIPEALPECGAGIAFERR